MMHTILDQRGPASWLAALPAAALRRIALSALTWVTLASCSPVVVTSGTPATPATQSGGSATTPAPATLNGLAVVDEIIARTNNERRAAGLGALARSVNLVRAAQIQADQMAARNQLDHDLPGAQYPTLGSRLTAVQYAMRAAGENIGEGFRSPSEAMSGWMSSPGHRANILSANYTEMGAGLARAANGTWYWVQVFGRPN